MIKQNDFISVDLVVNMKKSNRFNHLRDHKRRILKEIAEVGEIFKREKCEKRMKMVMIGENNFISID